MYSNFGKEYGPLIQLLYSGSNSSVIRAASKFQCLRYSQHLQVFILYDPDLAQTVSALYLLLYHIKFNMQLRQVI